MRYKGRGRSPRPFRTEVIYLVTRRAEVALPSDNLAPGFAHLSPLRARGLRSEREGRDAALTAASIRPLAKLNGAQLISSSSRRTADCASTPAGNANAGEDLRQFFAMRSRDRGRRVSSPAAGPHCLGFAVFVLCVDLLSSHPACPLYNINK